jgi:hypothetical protein
MELRATAPAPAAPSALPLLTTQQHTGMNSTVTRHDYTMGPCGVLQLPRPEGTGQSSQKARPLRQQSLYKHHVRLLPP